MAKANRETEERGSVRIAVAIQRNQCQCRPIRLRAIAKARNTSFIALRFPALDETMVEATTTARGAGSAATMRITMMRRRLSPQPISRMVGVDGAEAISLKHSRQPSQERRHQHNRQHNRTLPVNRTLARDA